MHIYNVSGPAISPRMAKHFTNILQYIFLNKILFEIMTNKTASICTGIQVTEPFRPQQVTVLVDTPAGTEGSGFRNVIYWDKIRIRKLYKYAPLVFFFYWCQQNTIKAVSIYRCTMYHPCYNYNQKSRNAKKILSNCALLT